MIRTQLTREAIVSRFQRRSGTTNMYVAPDGNSNVSGLSASAPTTLQAAADYIANYAPAVQGRWQINLAAGTYGPVSFSAVWSDRAIRVVGPATATFRTAPTAIIEPGDSGASTGILLPAYSNFFLKDIWVRGFDTAEYAGVRAGVHTTTVLENVHSTGNYRGYYFLDYAFYSAKGGIIDDCYYGVGELFHVLRNFKYAGSAADGTLISNCHFGSHCKEMCTGHWDYVEFADNDHGIFMSRSSSGNLASCNFKRNAIGVVLQGGSAAVDQLDGSNETQWNVGTADANTIQILPFSSLILDNNNNGENDITTPYVGLTHKTKAYDYAVHTLTGSSSLTALVFPLGAFPAGTFQAEGSRIVMTASGIVDLTATATLNFRVQSTNLAVFTLPIGTYLFEARAELVVTATGDVQRYRAVCWIDGKNPILLSGTRTLAFSTLDLSMGVWGQLTNSGDSLTVNMAEAWTTNG